jgi:hypothetical protein
MEGEAYGVSWQKTVVGGLSPGRPTVGFAAIHLSTKVHPVERVQHNIFDQKE